MSLLKTVGRVALLAATLPLAGCAAVFGGYDVAPNGLPRAEDALRRELAEEPARAYGSVIDGRRDLPDDDLLRLLYAGTAGRYSGQYGEGAHLLDLASYVAEDRVTTSVSREALSMITSDRSLAYVPGRTERLMIPYLAALAFIEAGNTAGAAVEARRIEALLDRMGEAGDGRNVSADARFLHLFAASVFEAAGEPDAADVAYRRAGMEADSDSLGEVVVLVERGFVPHRVEQSVVIVVPPWQVKALTNGDAGDKALAATEAAARILLTANHFYGDRGGYYRDPGYRSGIHLDPWGCDFGCPKPDEASKKESDSNSDSDDNGSDGAPYLLRISWPVLYRDGADAPPVRVRAGAVSAEAQAGFDVADAVRRDFEERRTAMIARTVARAASKLALSAGAKAAVGEKDEAAGHVVGFLANIGTMLTERADTRSWHLLPGSVSMVRLRLPAGTHDLELQSEGPEALSLGTVEVQPGRTAVVTHRLWR